MKAYHTIEEKTVEWNISRRHIQLLCRTEKIPGAVKRAGVWFIPDNAPAPTKYTKANVKDFDFVGTKNKIFNSAIELFLLHGFMPVSFKDIARHAGVRPSTVYNHFKTKQEILDTIYDFYCHYYNKERMNASDMELIMRQGSMRQIMRCIQYGFGNQTRQKMIDITKIIWQRIGVDARAAEIARTLMLDEGVTYIETVFNGAVETGRIAPCDTHRLAVFINTIKLHRLLCSVIDMPAENRMKAQEDEQALYNYAAELLTELMPSVVME